MSTSGKQVRSRFAPSPTGYVHIGNFRTGLFSFLFARHHGGVNILRVEDTDQSRKIDDAVTNMLSVMQTLGIEFDEGPYLENGELKERGEYGPYVQSARKDLYKKYAQELVTAGKAYYCFCSEERLADLRKEQAALKQPPMYDRHCRNLSADEVKSKPEEFKNNNQQPVIRQAIPLDGTTVVKDLVYGDISYDNAVLDDQVLLKSDGFPTYHLAVVVDDHSMEITHVIRGDDWIPSTPKHILLYQAFGWESPEFAHLPLILNPDKSKLSKRQGDVATEDFLRKGYLPEALVNFVAFLGWNPKTEQEIFSMKELIEQFDLSKVNKAGAVFDTNKLDWMNSQYLREKDNATLVGLCLPYWKEANISTDNFKPEYLEAVVALEKDRLKKLSDISENKFYFAEPEYDSSLLVWKKSDAADAKAKLSELAEFFEKLPDEQFERTALELALKQFITEKAYDNGSVLWPLRVALTGLEKSPGPFEVAATLHIGWGREGVTSRLKNAVQKL